MEKGRKQKPDGSLDKRHLNYANEMIHDFADTVIKMIPAKNSTDNQIGQIMTLKLPSNVRNKVRELKYDWSLVTALDAAFAPFDPASWDLGPWD